MIRLIKSEWKRTWHRKKTFLVIFGLLLYMIINLGRYLLEGNPMGHYNASGDLTPLNSLNVAPFLLTDFYFALVLFGLPLLVIESFNGEYTAGAYRLIIVRPYSFFQFLMSKIIVNTILLVFILIVPFVIGIIYGHLFLPKAEHASFYFESVPILNLSESYLFNIKFLFSMMILIFTLIGICILISILSSNSIIAYLAYFSFLIMSFYIYKPFMVFISGGRTLFEWLASNSVTNISFVLVCLSIAYSLSITFWLNRSWSK